MANKLVEIYSPKGDLVYPKTTASNVMLDDAGGLFTSTEVESALGEVGSWINTHIGNVATASALGHVKSGTDITVNASGNVTVADRHANTQLAHSWFTKGAIEGLLTGAITSHTHAYRADTWTPVTQTITTGNKTTAPSEDAVFSALSTKASFIHSHPEYMQTTHVANTLTQAMMDDWDTAFLHSQTTHAPSNAQKNSDILKSEIEAKLTGAITTHTHAYRADTWTPVTQVITDGATTTSPSEDAVYHALAGKMSTTLAANGITSTDITNWGTAYTHSQSAHAPYNANYYVHPSGFSSQPGTALSGANVVSQITVNGEGHVTGVTSRGLTLGDLGYTGATNANYYTHPTGSGNNHIPSGGSTGQFLKWSSDGVAVWAADNNTTYSNFAGSTAGLVPTSSGGTVNFLRADGSWATPPDTNTWIANALNTAGYVAAPTSGNANMVWKTDGSGNPGWRADADTVYSHPTGFSNQPGTALTGANVISQITVNTNGHVTGVTSRALTAANVGAVATSGNSTIGGILTANQFIANQGFYYMSTAQQALAYGDADGTNRDAGLANVGGMTTIAGFGGAYIGNGYKYGGTWNGVIDGTLLYLLGIDGSGNPVYKVSNEYTGARTWTDYQLYHEGHKPTAAEIGALASNGNAVSATTATYISAPDGDRANTITPNALSRSIRYDFKNGSLLGGQIGNYIGLMTYSPWDGGSASTGDSSYQLAFGSTAVNGGIPRLALRNGIDTTWNRFYDLQLKTNPITGTAATDIIDYKDVVGYTNNGPITGTIKITLPFSWTSTMMQLEIDGYDYNDNAAWKLLVGGYNYAPSSSWLNYSARLLGNAPFSLVRLAHDGTKCCILLGTTSTNWSYPSIKVSRFTAAFGSTNLNWQYGWSMSTITNETGIGSIYQYGVTNLSSYYHPGNKPSASDIGAAPLASPAFTGSPTVNAKAIITDSGTTARKIWVQAADPGASAADGDIWIKI